MDKHSEVYMHAVDYDSLCLSIHLLKGYFYFLALVYKYHFELKLFFSGPLY